MTADEHQPRAYQAWAVQPELAPEEYADALANAAAAEAEAELAATEEPEAELW